MIKGLDLIKRQQPEIIDGFPTGNIFIGVTKEELTELEKELRVLETIRKHIVNRDSDASGVYLEYCLGLFEPYYSIEIKRGANQIITEKEYDLLKEVLL